MMHSHVFAFGYLNFPCLTSLCGNLTVSISVNARGGNAIRPLNRNNNTCHYINKLWGTPFLEDVTCVRRLDHCWGHPSSFPPCISGSETYPLVLSARAHTLLDGLLRVSTVWSRRPLNLIMDSSTTKFPYRQYTSMKRLSRYSKNHRVPIQTVHIHEATVQVFKEPSSSHTDSTHPWSDCPGIQSTTEFPYRQYTSMKRLSRYSINHRVPIQTVHIH